MNRIIITIIIVEIDIIVKPLAFIEWHFYYNQSGTYSPAALINMTVWLWGCKRSFLSVWYDFYIVMQHKNYNDSNWSVTGSFWSVICFKTAIKNTFNLQVSVWPRRPIQFICINSVWPVAAQTHTFTCKEIYCWLLKVQVKTTTTKKLIDKIK